MRKHSVLVLEIVVIIACIFGINYFVDNILCPGGYITYLENYDGLGVPPNVEHAKAELARNRQFSKYMLYFIFSFALISYYCGKTVAKEMRKRNPPFDLVASNRKVFFMRMLSLLSGMLFLYSFFAVFATSPIRDMTDEGVKITNPLFGKDGILGVLICMQIPLFFSFGLYFVFKGIVDIFSLKFCFHILLCYVLIMLIAIIIGAIIGPYRARSYVVAGIVQGLNLPIFIRFNKKMDIAAKALGM